MRLGAPSVYRTQVQPPIARTERHIDWTYDGPNLVGVSGTGTEIGAGISGTRTDPDFITAPASN
jgi:hypothetical protein